ncbi:MAG: peptidoglycan DD-metalloendopeptidase family protein [Deltaproteobacteria bacterium]|nr:peptidoglycan DD-metalloendopeptidase family protein [Deltaproteobacteria bacterium]
MSSEPDSTLQLVDEEAPSGQHRARLILAAGLALFTGVNLAVIVLRPPADAGAPVVSEPEAVEAAPPALAGVEAVPEAPAPTLTLASSVPAPSPSGEAASRLGSNPADQVVSHRVITGRLEGRETVGGALARASLSYEQVDSIVKALKGVFDFRYARAGDAWRVKLDPDGGLLFFEYERSLLESYCVSREGEELIGYRKEVPVQSEVAMVTGQVESSLYESMIDAGESPGLALMLAEVLAWDIDFYRDPRAGDTFKIIVEKERYKSQTLRYGKILAAEYAGGVGRYRVFRYTSPTGGETFYDENGQSAQKALLKSPMKFAHITSTYGNRRHPILGYNRMHQGVDYGAPTGTPVWAVGDGTVVWAARKGASGNLVGLRHTNGYTSWYAHLSKIKVRQGQRVHQKDVVGLVGSTGRSTGPHLHYSVKKDGTFMDPLKIKLPPRRPLPQSTLPDYQKHIEPLQRWLDTQGEVAMLHTIDTEPL